MKKEFDCVDMKNKIQTEMYEQMKDMTLEERMQYIHERADKFWNELPRSKLRGIMLST